MTQQKMAQARRKAAELWEWVNKSNKKYISYSIVKKKANMDPILLRGLERIIIIAGAIIFAYLGYRLYRVGVEKAIEHLTEESKFSMLFLSGTGPGLFFMVFGGIVLTIALFTGKTSQSKLTEKVPIIKKESISQTTQILGKSSGNNEKSVQEQLGENFEKMREIQEQILNQKKSKDLSKEEEQKLLLELSKLRLEKRRLKHKLKYQNME